MAATGTSKKTREVPQLSILVVDDDPDVCEYLHDFLASEGYSAKLASQLPLLCWFDGAASRST